MTEHDHEQTDREAMAKHEGALAEVGAYPDDGATPYDAEEHRAAVEAEARERAEEEQKFNAVECHEPYDNAGPFIIPAGLRGGKTAAMMAFNEAAGGRMITVGGIEGAQWGPLGASAREEDRAARMEALPDMRGAVVVTDAPQSYDAKERRATLARELADRGAVVVTPDATPIGVGMPTVRLETPENASRRRMSPATVLAMAAGIAGGGVFGRRREVLTALHPGEHVLTDADRQRYSDEAQRKAEMKRRKRGARNLANGATFNVDAVAAKNKAGQFLNRRRRIRDHYARTAFADPNVSTAHEPNPPTLPLTKRVLVSMPPKVSRSRKGGKRRARREAHASATMGDGK